MTKTIKNKELENWKAKPPKSDSVPSWRAELGRRIGEIADQLGSRTNAARAAGVSTDQLARYISGDGEVSLTPVAKLCAAAGVLLDWSWRGGELRSAVGGAPLRLEKPVAGYAYVPLVEVRASAGHGAIIDREHVTDLLAFREEWLRQVLDASPKDVVLLYVQGRSMEPDLRAGDVIMIDIRDTTAEREAIYVLRMDGAILVKELQRLPGGVIRVKSKNPAYDTFDKTVSDVDGADDFAVIGRVVWACRRF